MFLIRAAFWLSVAILFIPADPETGTDRDAPRAVRDVLEHDAAGPDESGNHARDRDADPPSRTWIETDAEVTRTHRMIHALNSEVGLVIRDL